jgi:hypothetical protein
LTPPIPLGRDGALAGQTSDEDFLVDRNEGDGEPGSDLMIEKSLKV